MKNPIIVLTGPTASGKTALSFDIAGKYNCEIICADSMTIYKGLDIGTDKPTLLIQNDEKTAQETDGSYIIKDIPHHLINIVSPDDDFNVAIFKDKVSDLINQIQSRGHIPMLVGGSVLYIDALIYDYKFSEVKPDIKLREELEELSTEELFDKLCALDPDCEWTIDRHNRRRLIRAIEIFLGGNEEKTKKTKSALPENVIYLAVDKPREELYKKINKRVDEMFEEGFIKETESLLKKYGPCKALDAAGYKQIICYLEGKCTENEAREKTKQVHRNYAKRQLTWLRRNKDIKWIKTTIDGDNFIKEFLN